MRWGQTEQLTCTLSTTHSSHPHAHHNHDPISLTCTLFTTHSLAVISQHTHASPQLTCTLFTTQSLHANASSLPGTLLSPVHRRCSHAPQSSHCTHHRSSALLPHAAQRVAVSE